jgi:hypothetical protein
MTRSPALGRATRPLPLTHSRVGHEPAATLRTRALLLHAPTIARRPPDPTGSHPMARVGHSWRADPGLFSRASKPMGATSIRSARSRRTSGGRLRRNCHAGVREHWLSRQCLLPHRPDLPGIGPTAGLRGRHSRQANRLRSLRLSRLAPPQPRGHRAARDVRGASRGWSASRPGRSNAALSARTACPHPGGALSPGLLSAPASGDAASLQPALRLESRDATSLPAAPTFRSRRSDILRADAFWRSGRCPISAIGSR